MIKRKGEKVMGIISIVLNLIGIGFGVILLSLDASVYDQINEVLKEEGEMIPIDTLNAEVIAYGYKYMIASGIAMALTLGGIFFLKTDRRATISGILFLVAAVTLVVGTFMMAFAPMVLLFIIGLMALLKKPKTETPVNEYPS
ncbi:DUF4064 domain-containing protein [Bacillus sp. NPDC077027]|uniref:DUF4064 domain-containing protein n=1 Tax=Bacillus sp. NPDC077027 TaxID=3390548 RepID=UPI003CFBF416